MSWLDLISSGVVASDIQSPDFDSQPPPNPAVTPTSAGLGSPNAMTPWTGVLQPAADSSSSVLKEKRARGRQHKQKAKPSFFHSDEARDQDPSPVAEPQLSSPIENVHKSKTTKTKKRKRPPTFLNILSGGKSDSTHTIMSNPQRRQEATTDISSEDIISIDDLATLPVTTDANQQGHNHGQMEQVDDGLAMVDALRKEGKFLMSSAVPSDSYIVTDSPPQKPSIAKQGTLYSLAPKEESSSTKSSGPSNMKVKLPALELDCGKGIQSTAPDPFDIENIGPSTAPSQSAGSKPAKKSAAKRKGRATAPSSRKKPSTRSHVKNGGSIGISATKNSRGNDRGGDSVEHDTGVQKKAYKPRSGQIVKEMRHTQPPGNVDSLKIGNSSSKARFSSKKSKPNEQTESEIRKPQSAIESACDRTNTAVKTTQKGPLAITINEGGAQTQEAAVVCELALVNYDFSSDALTDIAEPPIRENLRDIGADVDTKFPNNQGARRSKPTTLDANHGQGDVAETDLDMGSECGSIRVSRDDDQIGATKPTTNKSKVEVLSSENTTICDKRYGANSTAPIWEAMSHGSSDLGGIRGAEEGLEQKHVTADATTPAKLTDSQFHSSEQDNQRYRASLAEATVSKASPRPEKHNQQRTDVHDKFSHMEWNTDNRSSAKSRGAGQNSMADEVLRLCKKHTIPGEITTTFHDTVLALIFI